MILLLVVTFIDLFALTFSALIIARIVFTMVMKPTSWLLNALINLTEPVMAPVRRVLPKNGNLDFSPTATVLLLYLIDMGVNLLIKKS